jgi:hypothetical protein
MTEMKWTSADERLPGVNEPVFVLLKDGRMAMLERSIVSDGGLKEEVWANCSESISYDNETDEWYAWDSDWDDDYDVAMWMPFPKRPKVGKDG